MSSNNRLNGTKQNESELLMLFLPIIKPITRNCLLWSHELYRFRLPSRRTSRNKTAQLSLGMFATTMRLRGTRVQASQASQSTHWLTGKAVKTKTVQEDFAPCSNSKEWADNLPSNSTTRVWVARQICLVEWWARPDSPETYGELFWPMFKGDAVLYEV